MISAGDLTAIIGDAERDGKGGEQYCGVWSLTSKHHVFNAFGNSYAGLLPGELRKKSPVLESFTDTQATLIHEPNDNRPVKAIATYSVSEPYYLDHTLTVTDLSDMRPDGWPYREVSWCCYMNSPEDPRIHFRSQGEWFRHVPPVHGRESNIAPAYESNLETLPPQKNDNGRWSPFHYDRIETRFDLPFYYGRVGPMVLILIFDPPQWLRFFISPSGGGSSLIPNKNCPAWDFHWIIPPDEYETDREYTFRVRAVYKPFVSDEDVLAEYERCRDELNFAQIS